MKKQVFKGYNSTAFINKVRHGDGVAFRNALGDDLSNPLVYVPVASPHRC